MVAMERGDCLAPALYEKHPSVRVGRNVISLDKNGSANVDVDALASEARKVALSYHGNALESWAATSDFVANYTGDDVEAYMGVMDRVFGHQGDGLQYSGDTSRDCFLCGIRNPDGTWRDREAIRPTAYYSEYSTDKASKFLNSDGFHSDFADPDGKNNQVQHTYYYVQLGYHHGLTTAYGGDFYHEYLQGRREGPWPRPGQSNQDYLAGIEGAQLGNYLYHGWITPYRAGDYIRNTFGASFK